MRKSLIITITAALLLAAVLCTAGCVEAPSDPIVGTYITETDSAVSWAVFENEGTGCFAGDAGDAVFTWAAADSKNTYTLTFADGRAVTAVLNAEHGVLNVNGVLYQKTVSPLSGVVIVTDQGVAVDSTGDNITAHGHGLERYNLIRLDIPEIELE